MQEAWASLGEFLRGLSISRGVCESLLLQMYLAISGGDDCTEEQVVGFVSAASGLRELLGKSQEDEFSQVEGAEVFDTLLRASSLGPYHFVRPVLPAVLTAVACNGRRDHAKEDAAIQAIEAALKELDEQLGEGDG